MKNKTLELTFSNPTAFRNLCGVNHRNITQIEQEFGVNIHAPGGKMLFEGKSSTIALASKAIGKLYERATTGINISQAEVTAVLSFFKTGSEKMQQNKISFAIGAKQIQPRNPAQLGYMQMLKDQSLDLVFGSGPAGTGKTFLAIAYGACLLLSKQIERMVVARPALEAGERLGFLPGDLEEKVDPYMMPIWDAFTQTLGAEKFTRLKENGKIEIAPLAFMRGRTFANAFIVLDEAQNATIGQMQMVLTRLGEGGRMVVTGDPGQSDLLSNSTSGLPHAISILDGVEGVGVTSFCADDVVRHPMVARIVRAYEADRQQQET